MIRFGQHTYEADASRSYEDNRTCKFKRCDDTYSSGFKALNGTQPLTGTRKSKREYFGGEGSRGQRRGKRRRKTVENSSALVLSDVCVMGSCDSSVKHAARVTAAELESARFRLKVATEVRRRGIAIETLASEAGFIDAFTSSLSSVNIQGALCDFIDAVDLWQPLLFSCTSSAPRSKRRLSVRHSAVSSGKDLNKLSISLSKWLQTSYKLGTSNGARRVTPRLQVGLGYAGDAAVPELSSLIGRAVARRNESRGCVVSVSIYDGSCRVRFDDGDEEWSISDTILASEQYGGSPCATLLDDVALGVEGVPLILEDKTSVAKSAVGGAGALRHDTSSASLGFEYISRIVEGEGLAGNAQFALMLASTRRTCEPLPLRWRLLITRNTPICEARRLAGLKPGHGVVALEPIPKGAFICEYVGEAHSIDAAAERERAYDCHRVHREAGETWTNGISGAGCCYVLELKGIVVDSTRKGNVSRLFNSHCSPNLRLVRTRPGKLSFRFVAARNISLREELCWRYNAGSNGRKSGAATTSSQAASLSRGQMRCLCGAENCRGFL